MYLSLKNLALGRLMASLGVENPITLVTNCEIIIIILKKESIFSKKIINTKRAITFNTRLFILKTESILIQNGMMDIENPAYADNFITTSQK